MTQTEPSSVSEFPSESLVSEDELVRQAMAADPDAPIDDDVAPLFEPAGGGLLPLWYMPPTAAKAAGGSRRVAIACLVIAALLVVVASGFCITYGALTLA